MNQEGIELIKKINQATTNKPIIFFCREAERAIGVENMLSNYQIACVESSYFVEQIKNQNKSIFCLELLDQNIQQKSTNELLKNVNTKKWIKEIAPNGFFGVTFKPQSSIKYHIEKLGGTYLGNDTELTKKLENKIQIDSILKEADINKPETIIKEISKSTYVNISKEIKSDTFFIQLEKGHTGNATHKVTNSESFEVAKELVGENVVKISEFIDGMSVTLNLNIDKSSKVFIGPMQVQITGIPDVSGTDGVTIGNDFTAGAELIKKLKDDGLTNFINQITKITKFLTSLNYHGLLGLDMIFKDDKFYLIEINARQSANIPFETNLFLIQKEYPPLVLLHYATLLGIEIDQKTFVNYPHLALISGSQVFFRATSENYKVRNSFKNGIYRLQSDNAAMNWEGEDPDVKSNIIFIDEAADKPLVFQKDDIYLSNDETGFIITSSKEGTVLNRLEEIGRIQMKEGALMKGKLKPWLKELYKVFV